MAVMCGVPSNGLPLSSSAIIQLKYALAEPHPLGMPPQVQVCHEPMLPLPWKKSLLTAMNAVVRLMLKGAAWRSRAARSHAACRDGAAAQWDSRPQGPEPGKHDEQTKPRGVSGTAGECFAQSASREPEQSVSQCAGPTWASLALSPEPSADSPHTETALLAVRSPW